jgi:uncharacterized protein YecE (DUF72 family)
MNNKVFLIGTSGWTYKHWRGLFYPEHLAQSHWFDYYTSIFSTVEVNATFYRSFKDQTYINWYNRSPVDFLFILKIPRIITHRKFLNHVSEDIKNFEQSASLLKEKLGLLLLQIAPQTPLDLDRLKSTLMAFEHPERVAVEFRSQQWLTLETRSHLEKAGAVFCDTDSPRIHLTGWVTSKIAYIRLHGRKSWYSYDYSQVELEEIAQHAKKMTAQGAERVFIYFNNDFEGNAPKNAIRLQNILAE